MTSKDEGRHSALIVEDDPRNAETVAEIASAAGCDPTICGNSAEALSLFRERRFCLVLLDLSIKGSKDSMKDSTAYGRAVLRDIRYLSQHHTGLCWWLPIIVMTAHLRDREEAVHVIRDGAAAIIDKPYAERLFTDTILAELERCGRKEHAGCESRPIPPAFVGSHIPIRLPGIRVGRRTLVYIGEARVALTNADLTTLLRLIAGGKKGVHKNVLGAKDDTGFHSISRLRAALRPVLDGLEIIDNDHHGKYSLVAGARVIECNAMAHAAIEDRHITELAKTIGASRRRSSKS